MSSGLDRYFTGTKCRNGHVAERRTSDKRCVQCLSEKWQRRYQNHADRYKATARRHYKMKSEIMKERSRRWYRDNKDRAKDRWSRYYEQHKCEIIAYIKHWASENMEQRRAHHINHVSRKKEAVGTISGEDIIRLMQKQNGRCFCGVGLMDGFTVDHIVPLSLGGPNIPDNIQLLCQRCNSSKGRKPDAEWKAARGF